MKGGKENMFNWMHRHIFIELNSNHSNCLVLRPKNILFGGEVVFYRWHSLKLLEHGDNKKHVNSQ